MARLVSALASAVGAISLAMPVEASGEQWFHYAYDDWRAHASLFATTWLIGALVFYVHPPGAAAALGVFYVVFAVFVSFMLASALLKRALAAVLVVAAPRFLIAGLAELTGNQVLAQAGAVLGFLLAAVALYTAFALLMGDSRGREVLPIGRLGAAREATHGTLAVELRGIERQPGVRRTL